MKFEVKLFAVAKERVGADTITVDVADDACVRDLRQTLAAQYPALSDVMRLMMVAVATDYASDDTPLRPGQEIALIPPVSGG
jgi:molybdopterin converting factor subunit 1